ncbi:Rho guanine nucleotide exchange factor 18 [Bagarius yarrelli]|uniref:Rho guanine nucleotide exchange factor 18 n=1 Tax=Bagarius yarrelli TaxID=175774 RepID=A0A556TZQ9_BAGYA|nr:Rho guanine nucleotide exchange factor 18 [Bagarius yarrelli]
MEESDQLRHKSVLDEFTADINIEDVQYSSLREDLESDARDFEAPTWSLSVDQEYMKKFSKEAVKRQDVIHELIQTEINHVRTLKLMLGVYLRELRDSLLMDETQLERLFPRLDSLLQEHQNFLHRLKNRRKQSLETGNAVNFYKEQLQSNKKFQNLIRRISQLSIVRRLGVPEGILLITQRITKYPVLLERIIKNTEAGTQEHENLVNALERIKETISTVDTQVHQYEQLRGIAAQLEPKSFGRMSNGKVFRREDLLQKDRRLLREGDGKPAVLPLQKLIVREAAHSDRALYLISASDVKADLYEFHTSTAGERSSWRQQIWDTIEKCPHMEEEELLEHEDIYPNKIREAHDLSEVSLENSTTARRLLLRGSAPELLQGELFINNAIIQAESLQMQLIEAGEGSDIKLCIKSQTLPAFNRMSKSGDGFRSKDQRPNSDPHLRDLYLHPMESSVCNTPLSLSLFFCLSLSLFDLIFFSVLQTDDEGCSALVSLQDSELEVLRAAQAERERPHRQRFSSIQDQERHRHLEKQREELLHLQKVHEQQRQEQETWARERQRHLLKMHELEQEMNHRIEECTNREAWLYAEREVLSRSREEYQHDLERLRESAITVQKEREKLEQESRRMRKHKNITNLGGASHLDNVPKPTALYSSPDDTLNTGVITQPGLPQERPPLAPPRKESISVTTSVKADVPIQLLSTTNEALKSSSIQQQIPTKLALSKGKEKNKTKNSHNRTNSADFSQEHTLNPKPPVSAPVPWKPAPPQNHQRPRSSSQEDVIYF